MPIESNHSPRKVASQSWPEPLLVLVSDTDVDRIGSLSPKYRYVLSEADDRKLVRLQRVGARGPSKQKSTFKAGELTSLRSHIQADMLEQFLAAYTSNDEPFPPELSGASVPDLVRESGAEALLKRFAKERVRPSEGLKHLFDVSNASFCYLIGADGSKGELEDLCSSILFEACRDPDRGTFMFHPRSVSKEPSQVDYKQLRQKRLLGRVLDELRSDFDSNGQELKLLLHRALRRPGPVAIEGPVGAGKTELAQRIAEGVGGPQVFLNAAALTETTLESRLRGHVTGAFTDAKKDVPGAFEQAHGGTLIIDEFQKAPESLQLQLLDLLSVTSDEVVVTRMGAQDARLRTIVKVVIILNEDIGDLVRQGKLRRDLRSRVRLVIRQTGLNGVLQSLRQTYSERGQQRSRGGKEYIESLCRAYWTESLFEHLRTCDAPIERLSPRFSDSVDHPPTKEVEDAGPLAVLEDHDWLYGFRDLCRVAQDLLEESGAVIVRNSLAMCGFVPSFRGHEARPEHAVPTEMTDRLHAVVAALQRHSFVVSRACQDLREVKLSDRGALTAFIRNNAHKLPEDARLNAKIQRLLSQPRKRR